MPIPRQGSAGIISALAFSSSNKIYSAGSLSPSTLSSPNIALFSEEGEEPVMFVGAEGVRAGVTQVNFKYLYCLRQIKAIISSLHSIH
jgi:telomerase Cajal body protein 1